MASPTSGVPRDSRARDLAVDAIAIVVAWSFAIAQPVLDLLGSNPAFFVAHSATTTDIVLLGLGLAIVAPAILAGLVALVSLAHATAGRVVHRVVLAVLLAEFALQVERRISAIPDGVGVVVAIAVGSALSWGYDQRERWRSFTLWLSPAPIVFLVLFLGASPTSALVFADDVNAASDVTITKPQPVVVLVLDEFPVISLMDRDGNIDGRAFPNFARLAARSTWYRNTTAVTAWTDRSVPNILTGTDIVNVPTAAGHPRNLFTMLGGAMPVEAYEALTHLCPTSICGDSTAGVSTSSRVQGLLSDTRVVAGHVLLPDFLSEGLPSIDSTWTGFGNEPTDDDPTTTDVAPDASGPAQRQLLAGTDPASAVVDFIDHLGSPDVAQLSFLHAEIPHVPWRYLPSGARYNSGSQVPWAHKEVWGDDPWMLQYARGRHLLQARYADTLVGQLLDAMDAKGLGDATLVVTADHGAAFTANLPRRNPTEPTIGDIAYVPLFIHSPGAPAAIDNRPAQLIDILPTIADVLGVKHDWKFDGASLMGPANKDRYRTIQQTKSTTIDRKDVDGTLLKIGPGTQRRDEALARKWAALGDATSVADPQAIYRIGPFADVIGAPAPVPDGELGLTLEVDQTTELVNFDPQSALQPVALTGQISGANLDHDTDVLIVANGTGIGTGRLGHNGGRLDAFIDPSLLVPGSNDIVALVRTDAGLRRAPLAGAASYALETSGTAATRLRSSDGAIANVQPDALLGVVRINAPRGPTAQLDGWAAIPQSAGRVTVVIFRNGRFVASTGTGKPRKDVAKSLKEPRYADSGFVSVIPSGALGDPETNQVRVFAIANGVASELSYLDDSAYRPGSR